MDAARFLPFAAAFLFVMPVLWARETGTVAGILYLFGTWLVLIVIAGALSAALAHVRNAAPPHDAPGDGGAP